MIRIEALLSFLAEDPDDAFTRFALATEYRKAGRLDEAIATFEALCGRDPSYVGTYYHLGKAYAEVGRRDRAAEVYRDGIAEATRQRDGHARSELQAALLELEDPDHGA